MQQPENVVRARDLLNAFLEKPECSAAVDDVRGRVTQDVPRPPRSFPVVTSVTLPEVDEDDRALARLLFRTAVVCAKLNYAEAERTVARLGAARSNLTFVKETLDRAIFNHFICFLKSVDVLVECVTRANPDAPRLDATLKAALFKLLNNICDAAARATFQSLKRQIDEVHERLRHRVVSECEDLYLVAYKVCDDHFKGSDQGVELDEEVARVEVDDFLQTTTITRSGGGDGGGNRLSQPVVTQGELFRTRIVYRSVFLQKLSDGLIYFFHVAGNRVPSSYRQTIKNIQSLAVELSAVFGVGVGLFMAVRVLGKTLNLLDVANLNFLDNVVIFSQSAKGITDIFSGARQLIHLLSFRPRDDTEALHLKEAIHHEFRALGGHALTFTSATYRHQLRDESRVATAELAGETAQRAARDVLTLKMQDGMRNYKYVDDVFKELPVPLLQVPFTLTETQTKNVAKRTKIAKEIRDDLEALIDASKDDSPGGAAYARTSTFIATVKDFSREYALGFTSAYTRAGETMEPERSGVSYRMVEWARQFVTSRMQHKLENMVAANPPATEVTIDNTRQTLAASLLVVKLKAWQELYVRSRELIEKEARVQGWMDPKKGRPATAARKPLPSLFINPYGFTSASRYVAVLTFASYMWGNLVEEHVNERVEEAMEAVRRYDAARTRTHPVEADFGALLGGGVGGGGRGGGGGGGGRGHGTERRGERGGGGGGGDPARRRAVPFALLVEKFKQLHAEYRHVTAPPRTGYPPGENHRDAAVRFNRHARRLRHALQVKEEHDARRRDLTPREQHERAYLRRVRQRVEYYFTTLINKNGARDGTSPRYV